MLTKIIKHLALYYHFVVLYSTGHMLTHQKKKSYRCSYPGCKKMYCGYRSLKRHCATQHGAYHFSPASQSCNLNTQPCPPIWEPPKLPALNDDALTSAEFHTYFPPLKSKPIFQFEGYTSHGSSYNSPTLAADYGRNIEDPNPSQVKRPASAQTWNFAADRASHNLLSSVDLSASHSTVTSDQWASGVGGSVVDPVEPEIARTWKCNLDVSVLRTWKAAPSFQPSKNFTGAGMGSQPSSACPRRNAPLLLNLNMQHEPHKRQRSLKSGEASYLKSHIVGSLAHQTEAIIPPLPSAPKTKKKREKNKKILKATNIPTPPLPSPRPSTQRQPRPRPAYLVSPSQVAMASFSKGSAPFGTLKVL